MNTTAQEISEVFNYNGISLSEQFITKLIVEYRATKEVIEEEIDFNEL